ncbi:MAG: late competence development ComFB family protein [Spirochaetes bacterium]|nr:late competence development ComFB family protein [Spirochaetota bacterium]
MAVTNLMHDIIVNAVEEVLKKEKKKETAGISSDEIVGYVLNRVPPKYVTSERGLLHGVLDAHYKIQQQVDILLLIYEAIEKISHGRNSNTAIKDVARPGQTSYFPHIIGQVLEESTLSVIPDIEVALLHGGKACAMIDNAWENPCMTKLSTKGHYHFWPLFDEKTMGSSASVPFTIKFSHPRCDEHIIDITLEILGKTDFGKSLFIPTALMKNREDSDRDETKPS